MQKGSLSRNELFVLFRHKTNLYFLYEGFKTEFGLTIQGFLAKQKVKRVLSISAILQGEEQKKLIVK